ncbi:hypothetical protein [Actinoplanes sp. CA-252034]|uniref:hypothetical protein n=1 Tax=Actinoplanes sp. CA-252034 TaxID=3239906 RepID=UPI003D99FE58
MGIVRVYETDDYWPEYGLLLLQDVRGRAADLQENNPPRGNDGTSPAGTFAGAGAGWIAAQAGNDQVVVRLELHDAPPEPDMEFDDVLETPYHAASGGLALCTLTGGSPWQADFDLDDAVRYRVRIARRGDTWLLRFWSDAALDPPVWLARSASAVGGGGNGWHEELPHGLMEVAYLVGNLARDHGGWLTVEQLDQWWRTHHHPETGLDEPLWPDPARRPTTGHADLDQRNADQRVAALAHQAKQQGRVDEIAAELGAAPVRTRREALPLLVRAGILQHEEPDRFRAGRPASVDTVLKLPAERVRQLREARERSRFSSLAEDVAAVLRWAPTMPLEVSAALLAVRLLVDEDNLRGAVAYAEKTGLLHVLNEEPLRLIWGRRPEPALAEPVKVEPALPEPAPAEPAESAIREEMGDDEVEAFLSEVLDVEEVEAIMSQIRRTLRPSEAAAQGAGPAGSPTAQFFVSGIRPKKRTVPDLPPLGFPPRAGMIETNGTVVTWHDGNPVELARLGGRDWHSKDYSRAVQTRHGILVMRHGSPARLVSDTGEMTEIGEIGTPMVALFGDGRRVAHRVYEHSGRSTRNQLKVVDLADGSSTNMPWPQDRDIHMLGVHDSAVYFTDRAPETPSVQERVTMRWVPGSDPQQHPHQLAYIDPLSGTGIRPATDGTTVIRPDGTTVHVRIDSRAGLVPGAGALWTVRGHPPAVTLFPVEPDPTAQAWWLPFDGVTRSTGTYKMSPTWEDADHVLFPYGAAYIEAGPATGVRLSLRDGSTERLPTSSNIRLVQYVEPLLTP